MKKIDVEAILENSRKVLTGFYGDQPLGKERIEAHLALIRWGAMISATKSPGDVATDEVTEIAHSISSSIVTVIGLFVPPKEYPAVLAGFLSIIEFDFLQMISGSVPGETAEMPVKDVGDA